MFNLQRGIITIPSSKTKTYSTYNKTIPQSIIHLFIDDKFSRFPNDYFVFGSGFEPHANKRVARNLFYRRHKKILDKLYKEEKISMRQGLSTYSWKHTGISTFLKSLQLIDVQGQSDHKTPNQTIEYNRMSEINEGYRNLPYDLRPNDNR